MNGVNSVLNIKNFQNLGSRDIQEDSIFINQDLNIYAVCDGIGGVKGGEIASSFIVNAIETELNNAPFISTKDIVEDIVSSAYKNFIEYGLQNEITHRMGTTLIMLVIANGKAIIAHVGDSRAFYFSKKNDNWISKDHSLVQELFEAGVIKTEEEMLVHPYKNKITNALMINSNDVSPVIEINEIHNISKGDFFILCSDGAIENFSNSDMSELFKNETITMSSRWEIFRENANMSSDNSSAILISL